MDDAQQERWMKAQITRKEYDFFQQIIQCKTQEAVEAAVTFAAYINKLGLTPENYPVYLSMLEIENQWVVEALIGDMDPFTLLTPVQPNNMIISKILHMMAKWNRGGIYPKNLSVILGVLKNNFSSPEEGYVIYQLKIADVNGVAKHLDKSKSQDNPLNRAILDILFSLSRLKGETGSEKSQVASHATAIRNAFFDDLKTMEDVIPAGLLSKAEGKRDEIKPRKQAPPEEAGENAATPAKLAAKKKPSK